MHIARFDVTIKRGETWCQDAVFRDKATKEPLNLTGMTVKAQVRPSKESETLLADIDCDVFPEEGRVQLLLTKTQTAAIEPGFYAWDLKLTDIENDAVSYDIDGWFIVDGRVTI